MRSNLPQSAPGSQGRCGLGTAQLPRTCHALHASSPELAKPSSSFTATCARVWTVTTAAFIHQHQSALALEGHPHRYPKAYLPATPFGADFEAFTKHAGPIVPLGPHLPPLKTPPFLEGKPLQSAGWRSILKADLPFSPILLSSGCSQTAGAPHQPCTPPPHCSPGSQSTRLASPVTRSSQLRLFPNSARFGPQGL